MTLIEKRSRGLLLNENGRFYTTERIIRLDELGPTFVVCLVMRF